MNLIGHITANFFIGCMILCCIISMIITISLYYLICNCGCFEQFRWLTKFFSCSYIKKQQIGEIGSFFRYFSLFGVSCYFILCILYTIYPFLGYYSTAVWHKYGLEHTYLMLDVMFARPLWALCKFPIYILFLARLYVTFKNTYYSVDKKYYILLLVLIICEMIILVFCNLGLILPFVNPDISTDGKLFKFWENIFVIMLLCDIIADTIIGIVFTTLFVSKLKQMTQNDLHSTIISNKTLVNNLDEYLLLSSKKNKKIRSPKSPKSSTIGSSKWSSSTRSTRSTIASTSSSYSNAIISEQHEQIIHVMTKFTILCIVSMISTWLCGFVAGIRTYLNINHGEECPWQSNCYITLWMMGDFLIAFDSLVNIMCFYLSFAIQEKIYMCLCWRFHQCCSDRFQYNIEKKTIMTIQKSPQYKEMKPVSTTIIPEEKPRGKMFEVTDIP